LGSVALFRGIVLAGVPGGSPFIREFGANTIKQSSGAFNGIRPRF